MVVEAPVVIGVRCRRSLPPGLFGGIGRMCAPVVFYACGLTSGFCWLPCFMRPLSRPLPRCRRLFLSLPASTSALGLSLWPRICAFSRSKGLDAQIVQVRNGQVAVSALAANEAQFYASPLPARASVPWPEVLI